MKESGTYGVDYNGREDGRGNGGSVRGIFCRAHHGVVVGFEEEADDGEDDDSKAGHDDAMMIVSDGALGLHQGGTYQDHACITPKTGFIFTGSIWL